MHGGWITSACALLMGCGRLSFDPRAEDGGAISDVPADACMLGPWSAPVPLTAVNSPLNEWAPTLSPDGLTLMFSSERDGNEDLFMAVRASAAGPFSPATAVAGLNSSTVDTSAIITRDGRSLYFASSRNGVSSELFIATRDPITGAIGAPALVPELAGTSILGATVSADGSEMFFGGTGLSRAVKGTDGRFQIEGQAAGLEPDAGYPSLSTDGRTIYFGSRRDGPYAAYFATRTGPGAPFGAGVHIPEISVGVIDDMEISADDRALVFTTDREGDYDLWISTRPCS